MTKIYQRNGPDADKKYASSEGSFYEFPDSSANNYRITGYTDGDLSVHCTNTSTGTVWDGSFNNYTDYGNLIEWRADTNRVINVNKTLRSDFTRIYRGEGSSCEWRIQIYCDFGNVWTGRKYGGVTPVGEYTRINGNDLTATLDIEEY
jgi:hypothetical protein